MPAEDEGQRIIEEETARRHIRLALRQQQATQGSTRTMKLIVLGVCVVVLYMLLTGKLGTVARLFGFFD